MNCYVITWMRKPMAQPYLIDVDTPEMAAEIGLRLASDRLVHDVKVTEIEYPEDKEMKERIWKRINERMREYQMEEWAFSAPMQEVGK